MASGDTLLTFTPASNEPPATVFATLDTRNAHPVLDFDDAANEDAVFSASFAISVWRCCLETAW